MAEAKPDAKPPEESTPAMASSPHIATVRPMTPDEIRAAEAATMAAVHAEVMERDVANGPEGGRYKVGDDFVNANGEPIKK